MGEKKKSGLGKFIAGAAVGAGLALLFAPQDGKTTRAQLKKKLDELADKIKNIDIEEVKENIEIKIEEIKAELADLDKEKVIAIAKEKGKALLKKCDELVKYAKKAATPVVEKAADAVRVKTIEVLEATIAKLEQSEPVPAGPAVPKTEKKSTSKKKTSTKKTTK